MVIPINFEAKILLYSEICTIFAALFENEKDSSVAQLVRASDC